MLTVHLAGVSYLKKMVIVTYKIVLITSGYSYYKNGICGCRFDKYDLQIWKSSIVSVRIKTAFYM